MKLLKIKPFQETLNAGMCGPAVLKMVLQFYGIEKSERALAKLTKTSRSQGTDGKAIVSVLKHFGLRTLVKRGASFAGIDRFLKRGVPIIVDWFTRGRTDYPLSAVPDGHYSIVVGLDARFIYLQDPEIGKLRKLTRNDFLRVWFDYSEEFLITPQQMIIRQLIAVSRGKS